MINKIQNLVRKTLKLSFGINKSNEIARLVYEIQRRENIYAQEILKTLQIQDVIANKDMGYLGKFGKIKKYLLQRRFPNAYDQKDFSVYLNRPPASQSTGTAASMNMREPFYPDKIFIESQVKSSLLAKRATRLFPNADIVYIENLKNYNTGTKSVHSPYDLRKRDIFITSQKWDFFKQCPCSKGVVCCNYHIFNLGFGCPYDCSYCYLQHYTNFPGVILDANLDTFLNKLDAYLKKLPCKTIRIGTGEFTDSLALDHITEYSKALVPFFASRNALFELKTKSTNIKNLMGLHHNEKTVVSWSLNPGHIIDSEELGTASLKSRLHAARKCREGGYKVGFHFDPIFYYENWQKDYKSVVDMLFDSVNDIEWISLGTFRFSRLYYC